MKKFKITRDAIEKGIAKKMKDLTKLKSLLDEKSLLNEEPKTVFFDDLDTKEAANITASKLKKRPQFEYMETIEKAIYIVSAPDFPYLREEIDNDNGDFKKLKVTTALPRISDEKHWKHYEEKNPKCLYVGSSHEIVGRVIQHFWKCAKGTYSLHLIEWDWWKEKNKVQIDIWDASKIASDVYFQIIEDIVWDTYKPLFGRAGAK